MPAMDFEVNIDLHNNELKNVVIDKVESDPTGHEGQIIYNTTQKVLKYYHDNAWVPLAQGGDLSAYQLKAEKGQANGYAGLDGNSKVILGQLPTGIDANSIPLIVTQITDGAVLQYSSANGGFVPKILGMIYQYKGTASTYAELPDSGQQAGDVWNVETAYQNYPAGTNFAWDGTKWDALGGTVDLSGYQTIANLKNDLSSPSASTYPSTQAVSTALAAKQDVISLTPDMAVVSGSSGALKASSTTSVELGYVHGVTSPIQTQLAAKQATITGAATTIASSNLTSDRALIADGTGKVAVSSVTSAELAHLSGVTSGIQEQFSAVSEALNGKVDQLVEKPTAGTYPKVTINDEGLVTAGEALTKGDIPALDYIPITQKGAASGVATLGTDSTVPIAQIPTGNAANKVPVLSGAGTAGQAIVINEDANGFAFANLLERVSATITGNDTTTSFPIEHGLRGPPVGIVIVNSTTKKVVQAEVTYTNETTITVAFNTAPATGTNYIVYMVG